MYRYIIKLKYTHMYFSNYKSNSLCSKFGKLRKMIKITGNPTTQN